MIVKAQLENGKVVIRTKPSHSGRDKQHAILVELDTSRENMVKMQGKMKKYFHAHMNQDTLVLDDEIEDQRW